MHVPKYTLVKTWCRDVNFFIKNYPEMMNYCIESFKNGKKCIFYKRVYVLEGDKICQYKIRKRKKVDNISN